MIYNLQGLKPLQVSISTNLKTYLQGFQNLAGKIKRTIMKRVDYEIIGKKIVVGIILFLVPLAILAGGLTIINQFLK
nr:hypothetical protein [uncultured Flavobacterium sp.]